MEKQRVFITKDVDDNCDSMIIVDKDGFEFIAGKEQEGYFFTAEKLIEFARENFRSGVDRIICVQSPHNALNGFPPDEDEYIDSLNIK